MSIISDVKGLPPARAVGRLQALVQSLRSENSVLLNRLEKEQMAKVQVNIRKNAIDKAKKEIEESQKLREDKDGELWVEDE